MAGHIPWRVVDLTLSATRSIWVATTRPDGRPHAMPVWFTWEGHDVCFITQRSTQKARNLATQSWVVVHAGDGDDAIILEGRVEIVVDRRGDLAAIGAAVALEPRTDGRRDDRLGGACGEGHAQLANRATSAG